MNVIKLPKAKLTRRQILGLKEHKKAIASVKDFFSVHENILTLSPEELRLIQGIISGKGGGRGNGNQGF